MNHNNNLGLRLKTFTIALLFFIMFSFVSWFSLAEEQNDAKQAFILLSPAEQLEKIFRETKYFGIDYMTYRTVFLENHEAKSLLFSRFKAIEVQRYGDPVNYKFSILDNMLAWAMKIYSTNLRNMPGRPSGDSKFSLLSDGRLSALFQT
jgi:hypothetical protein